MQRIIKIILNLFSRKFLIKISLLLKPIFELIFKGNNFRDPINNKSYSYFFPYGYNKLRKNALSPGTLSLEDTDFFGFFSRRRQIFLIQIIKYYISHQNNVFIKFSKKNLIHILLVTLIHLWQKLRLIFATFHLEKMNLTMYYVTTF